MFDEHSESIVSSEFFHDAFSLTSQNLKEMIHNQDYEIWKYKQIDDNTGLHRAVLMNSIEVVKILINELKVRLGSKGEGILITYVNKKNNQGLTALHLAVLKGNLEITNFLIQNNANIELITNRGLSCLHIAAQGNKPSMLVFFKEKFEMNIRQGDNEGSTPLHWACYNNSLNAAEFLLSWDVNVNAQDKEGLTPLHLAVKSDNIKIVQILIQHGANPNIKSNDSITPKMVAHAQNFRNIVLLFNLLEKSCKLFSISNAKQTKIGANCTGFLYFIINLVTTLFLSGAIILVCPIDDKKLFPSSICKDYKYFNLELKLNLGLYQCLTLLVILLFSLVNGIFYICLYNSNPGINTHNSMFPLISLINQKEVDITHFCPFCKVIKNATTRHCQFCNKCFDNNFHHCIMLNNCIGKKNIGYLKWYFGVSIFTLICFIILSLMCNIYLFIYFFKKVFV